MSIALIIVQGTVTVTLEPSLSIGLRQDYRPIEAATLHRMADGTGLKQSRWSKLATTLSGDEVLPVSLEALDYSSPMAIWCVQPRRLSSVSAVIALPAARRTDVPPYGFALVSGRLVPVDVAVVGDVATLDTVAGASGYALYYHPILTVYAVRPTESGDIRNARYGWELTAEEV